MKTHLKKLFDDISKNVRALKIMTKHEPWFFFLYTAKSLLEALAPYAAIFFSARLIDELAGDRDPRMLFTWTLAILLSEVIISTLKGILIRRCGIFDEEQWRNQLRVIEDKMKSLDFPDANSTHTINLINEIERTSGWSDWGLIRVTRIYEKIITALIRIVLGISLCVSLFTRMIPEGNELSFLNHKIFILLIIGLMFFVALLVPAFGAKVDKCWQELGKSIMFGNRVFSYYGFLSDDNKRAADLRIYKQQDIARDYFDKNCMYSENTEIDKMEKGPLGIWSSLESSVSMLLTGFIYLFVCLKAWAGAFGIGAVTQYIGAATNTFMGIKDLLNMLTKLRSNAGYLDTVYEFLDIPNKMYQGCLTTEKRIDRKYEVEFRDVSFKYPETEDYVLRHVNIKFKIGEKLAVVGMNGSGKTTFIKLLCRLYDPTEGEILLNGINIKKYRYDEYMDIFSVVFQDFNLFSRPLDENVAGSIMPDEERVIKCLNDAGFVLDKVKMTKGLKTWLYKNLDKEGVEISGGEAQKIAIARALYKDAPFIILDEPTAALDPIAEAEIYEKFNDIVGDKTAVYISHRLSSCKFCDEIAVFHEGTVIQKGSHEELLRDTKGKYYELWNAQAQYYDRKSA